MPAHPDILELLARQDGLITCAQATGLGRSPRTLRSRLHTDGSTVAVRGRQDAAADAPGR